MEAGKGLPDLNFASDLIKKYRHEDAVFVTRPSLPDFNLFAQKLQRIWASRWLTNEGEYHKELERRLCDYLGVEHLSLFCNGTIALLVAIRALGINGGEIITTPFTFPATVHALQWSGITPVFSDIDGKTCNLDPKKIKTAITPNTKAILAVHVYGKPCDVDAIDQIAHEYNLAVIYDAAHAFGVQYRGRSILQYGDVAALSFHATKLFMTAEGGALVCHTQEKKKHIDYLKNFGIADEETIIEPGINGKMNELQAALGLLQLSQVDEEIAARKRISSSYRNQLEAVSGICFLEEIPGERPNHSYLPVLIDGKTFGISRDELYIILRRANVFARKYFYPLCSHFPCYSSLASAAPENLPMAERVSRQVLCLPIHGSLDEATVQAICGLIREIPKSL